MVLASDGKWLMILSSNLSSLGEDLIFNEEMAIVRSFSLNGASRNWLALKSRLNLSWKTV